jgi:hypothetical protein
MGNGHFAPGQRAHALRRVLGLLALLATIAALLGTTASPASAAADIENAYKATGTWAVSTANVSDSGGKTYVVHYPTNLGSGGYDHPVITWGNGTGAAPSRYTALLNHLASWGFVVIATTSTGTGTGNEMLAGAQYLVAENGRSGSQFYQNLDTGKVGAMGHSQGASGALNATTKSNGLIVSTMVFNLPNEGWISGEHKTDFTKLTRPVFLVTGTGDTWISTASGNTSHYNKIPGPAAKAVLKGAGHNTVQNAGNGFLGYATAWARYTLAGDQTARGAFVGNPPEINTNTNWQNQAQKNGLP